MSDSPYAHMKILNAWDAGETIKLVYKEKEGDVWKRKRAEVRDFEWYFAITEEDYNKREVQGILKYYHQGGIVLKVDLRVKGFAKIYAVRNERVVVQFGRTGAKTCHVKDLVSDLAKEGVRTYEADLSKWKRFMIDNKLDIATDVRILYFDIETDDRHGGIVVGRDEIISWAATDDEGNVFFMRSDEAGGEKKLLSELVNLLHSYDVICGWNSSGFDIPYIVARMEVHSLKYDIEKNILHIDLMQRCAKMYSFNMLNMGLKGFSLNEVSRFFLGEKKVEHKLGIYETYEQEPDLLKKYNIHDTTLLYELDRKLLITDLMLKECNWTGSLLAHFYVGELLDNIILRKTHDIGAFQHSRPARDEMRKTEDIQIRGGYVMPPIVGLHTNVAICDFKSLYPSIMVGYNIGRDSMNEELSEKGFIRFEEFLAKQEKKIEEVEYEEWAAFLKKEKEELDPHNEYIQAANNVYFSRDTISFIGGLVKYFLEQRATWKAQAKKLPENSPEWESIMQSQGMVKEMANSMFGITCDKRSRYFHQYIAEAITLSGQFLNRTSSFIADKHGYPTIYGDTDSILISTPKMSDMDDLIVNMNVDLKAFLENDIGVVNNIVLLEYEKAFKKLIMLDKKRYTGWMTMYDGVVTDKIFSRGTENIKKNTIPLARDFFVELIEGIVKKGMTFDEALTLMLNMKNKVLYGEVDPAGITTITRVSKAPSKYKVKPLHVRLASRLIKEGKMLPIDEGKKSWGTRLEYIVVIDKEGKQEGSLPDEYEGNWDRLYYWDSHLFGPFKRFAEIAWPEYNWKSHSIAQSDREYNTLTRLDKKLFNRISLEHRKIARYEKAAEKDIVKKEKDYKKLQLSKMNDKANALKKAMQ